MSSSVPSEEMFAGFWPRVWATLIDSLLLAVIIVPVLLAAYGREYWESTSLLLGPVDFLMSWVFPSIAVIVFWIYKGSTPGKMALGMRIVDSRTGGHASTAQYVGRYFAYFLSLLPLAFGFFWIVWDARKQGWHDKLANTVVVRRKRAPVPHANEQWVPNGTKR